MALNATELKVLAALVQDIRSSREDIDRLKASFPDLKLISGSINDLKSSIESVEVLSIGYPDLLVVDTQLDDIFGYPASKNLKMRDNPEQIARDHGREILKKGVFETIDVFAKMGAKLIILDAIAWTGKEIICDMNQPLSDEHHNRFDLIIDPGSLEHIFNVAQGVANMAHAVRVGGYVYHQNPLAFINHGFYSISPTFYMDFYLSNGFTLKELKYFNQALDEYGFEVNRKDLDPYRPMLDIRQNATNSIIAQKERELDIRWPIQKIYRT